MVLDVVEMATGLEQREQVWKAEMSGFSPQKIKSIIVKAQASPAFKPQSAPQLNGPKLSTPATIAAPKIGRPNGALVGSQSTRAMQSGYPKRSR